MSLHATDSIDDAIDATKEFLLPFEKRTWLRLAVVVFFLGGGGVGNVFQFVPDSSEDFSGGGEMGVSDPEIGAVVVAAILLLVLFLLVWAIVSSVMQFVFTRSLIDQEVHVRRYFKQNLGNGVQLFVFQIAVILLFGGITVAMALAIFGPSLATENPGVLVGGFLLLLLVFFVVWLVFAVVMGFTTVFAVPIMLATGENIIGAWRRLWNAIWAEPKEYAAYLALSVALGIGVGVVMTIATFIAAVVFGIPLLVVGLAAFAALPEVAALAVTAVVGIVLALAFLLTVSLVQAPLLAFLRYYAMFVLGGTEESLDPIPEVRAQVAD